MLKLQKELTNKLNIVDTQNVMENIMFSRQRVFEYANKPGKQLSKLLAEHSPGDHCPNMVGTQGKVLSHPLEKLIWFFEFSSLYLSSNPKELEGYRFIF